MYSEHDNDFYALWNSVNADYGLRSGESVWRTQISPLKECPVDQIALVTGRKMIYLQRTQFQKHSSKLAKNVLKDATVIQVSRRHDPSVIVRLIQLAKGLNPADMIPFSQVSNVRGYWDYESQRVPFRDNYVMAGRNVPCAIKLYVQVYRIGNEHGMHPVSRKSLIR